MPSAKLATNDSSIREDFPLSEREDVATTGGLIGVSAKLKSNKSETNSTSKGKTSKD
jgi:hypothetical protein